MHRKPYVFGYDAEPAEECPTGFGQSQFDVASALTAPASWQASEYSTFDEPSRAQERIEAIHRERAMRARLAMVVAAVIGAAAIVSIASLV
jgi:hypothetical protein